MFGKTARISTKISNFALAISESFAFRGHRFVFPWAKVVIISLKHAIISRNNFDFPKKLTFDNKKTATMMTKEQVKQLRESLGMTQEQFADVMCVSCRTISNWETGATIPKAKEAHMKSLHVRPQTIYGDVAMAGDVTGKNATITNNTSSIDANQAMKALLKSQEQIDRLIGVIENITGTPFAKQ